MACHRSAELVGDGSWRRRQNVNRLLKLLLKTKGSHVYRCNIEVDVTRYLQTVTAKSKSNFWRKEYSWALDHSKSHAEPGTSSFSHIIPSPVPHPCRSPSTGRRGGGCLQGMLLLPEAVSTHGASLVSEQHLAHLRRWNKDILRHLRSSGCSVGLPYFFFFDLFISQREVSQRSLVFSLCFLFP